MAGMRALTRTRWSGGFLAAAAACLLVVQALIASVGLGMLSASPFGQPEFEICSAVAANSLDAPARSDKDPGSHRPQCPFCFVGAKCVGHPAAVGDAKAFPTFVGRGINALPYSGAKDGAFAYRLHRTTGDPRGPPSFSV